MEFSKRARCAIVLSIALWLIVFVSYLSFLLLFDVNELASALLLLGFVSTVGSVVDLTMKYVMRPEAHNCPLQWEDYSAAQKEWERSHQKHFWSGIKPSISLVFLCVSVFAFVGVVELLLVSLKSAPQNIRFYSAAISPIMAIFLGIIWGNCVCNRRQKYLSELMAIPDQEPDEMQSQNSSLPPIPSPYKLP